MIRILIVDDEPSAGNILRLLIEKNIHGDKLVKVCQSPKDALKIIDEFQPSLLMLDIEMPHMNGFDLLNQTGNKNFDVIFTTAYDKYAIRAIRFSALDYLLKPIDILDLQNAINRHIIKQQWPQQRQSELVNNLINNLRQPDISSFKLAVNTIEGTYFFAPLDITICEGENNYTHFHFIDRPMLIVSKTLKEYEDILSEYGFIRIHKSYLVNIAYVVRLDKDGLLWMKDGNRLAVSRRRKEEVIQALSRKK